MEISIPKLRDANWLAQQAADRSASAIARELGTTPDTVLRAMRLHGIPTRPPPYQHRRPSELEDPVWLAEQYATRTAADIAEELGVGATMVTSALQRHGIAMRSRSERHKLNSPPELDDADWLRAQYRTKPASQIAAELGVSKPLAHKAMRQLGIEADGPWVRRDNTRLTPPRAEVLADAWDADPTVKGIARRLGVSPTTAAVWLADAGIFVKETPAISQRDLAAEIDAGQPIEQIARKYRVAPSTVAIELRRHGLREAHRHRPRRAEDS